MAKDTTNIVLGYHLLGAGDHLKIFKYIPSKLEQLSTGEDVFSENAKTVLTEVSALRGYSIENMAFQERKYANALHAVFFNNHALIFR
jgi:hypothetical protein